MRLLKTRFVPVAIDQAYQRRQQDTEGEFYRQVAAQAFDNFESTTQGFYIATAAGELLLYNNNRDPAKLRRLMKQKLKEFAQGAAPGAEVTPIEQKSRDPKCNVTPPLGGLVLRVRAKVLGGYQPTRDRWRRIFQTALSRDNLWVSAEERQALIRGELPRSLQERIARFHLVDNTRGEPPLWKRDEIRQLDLSVNSGQLSGTLRLETVRGDRGYEAELRGYIDAEGDTITRLDIVVLGQFWGQGPYTRGAPRGKFPLAVSFTLADGNDVADGVPPQGSRGWLAGYLQ